jgi:hypothetical protein
MGIKSWYGSQSDLVKAAFVAGILALIGGIIAGGVTGGLAIANTEIGKSSPPRATGASTSADSPPSKPIATTSLTPTRSDSASTAAAPTKASSCLVNLRITAPAEDTIVSNGASGLVIKGTACGLGSDSGWLFDFDPDDGYYYDDYAGSTPTPAVQSSLSGSWQFPDSPIGNPGDKDKHYTITLVLASQACDKLLRSEQQIDGDYKLRTFPAGCKVVEKIDVYVTYAQT